MRFRLLGEYVYVSIAVLAVVEFAVYFVAFILAAVVRFGADLPEFERLEGPLWPTALLFSLVMMVCLLAFGLYSARQRARVFGIAMRVLAAVIAGVAVTAIVCYIIPALRVGRGVMILASVGALAGVTLTRTIFSRVVHDDVFKRRALVYGSGYGAAAIAQLRRRSDRRGSCSLDTSRRTARRTQCRLLRSIRRWASSIYARAMTWTKLSSRCRIGGATFRCVSCSNAAWRASM
jgi:FlaA1/EpsC-like NDP-sugar epimerase